jgi:hypothetical protein
MFKVERECPPLTRKEYCDWITDIFDEKFIDAYAITISGRRYTKDEKYIMSVEGIRSKNDPHRDTDILVSEKMSIEYGSLRRLYTFHSLQNKPPRIVSIDDIANIHPWNSVKYQFEQFERIKSDRNSALICVKNKDDFVADIAKWHLENTHV